MIQVMMQSEQGTVLSWTQVGLRPALLKARPGHIRMEDNLADLLTEVTYGAKRKQLVQLILRDIFGNE